MMSLRSTALGKIEGKEFIARIYLDLQDNMSSLFSVYLLATAVQLYVQGTKSGCFVTSMSISSMHLKLCF